MSEEPNGTHMRYTGDLHFKEAIVTGLKTVYDPEIPVDIYELGLIYGVQVNEVGNVTVEMTLTSPNCPAAESIPLDVKEAIRNIQGLNDVRVEIVWEPTWTQEYMSDVAKVTLGMY